MSMEKMAGLGRSLAKLQLLEHQPSGPRVELLLESPVTVCGREPFHYSPPAGCGVMTVVLMCPD